MLYFVYLVSDLLAMLAMSLKLSKMGNGSVEPITHQQLTRQQLRQWFKLTLKAYRQGKIEVFPVGVPFTAALADVHDWTEEPTVESVARSASKLGLRKGFDGYCHMVTHGANYMPTKAWDALTSN